MSLTLILEDIQRALKAGAPYAALAATVTLPEVCMRCEFYDPFATKGLATSERMFQRFVQIYLPDWSLHVTGEDLFHLRNAISHKGATTQRNKPLRYVFHPPSADGSMADNNREFGPDGVLLRLDIDLQKFCDDISAAVRRWEVATKDNATVQANLHNVLQVREGGFGMSFYMPGLVHIA